MSARGTSELRALTSARGIAAWAVVLYHVRLGIAHLPPLWVGAFSYGYLAVDFFFVLSGFVIWLSWRERLARDGWAAVPAFLHRRIARIWPLHLLMLAGATCFAVTIALAGRADPVTYPFRELPLHVLLLQNWGFTDRLSWNVPAWSISCEFAAYLIFPLVARRVDWARVPGPMVIGAIGMLTLALTIIVARCSSLSFDIAHFGLARCLVEFTIGGAVCGLWQRWRDRPAVPTMVAAGLTAAGAIGWWAGAPEPLMMPPTFAALLLLLALTASARGNPLNWRPLHYLGEISYATYLSHYLLFIAFKLAFVDDAQAIPPMLIGGYLLLVLLASVILYHLVELPAQRWVNGLSLSSRLRRAGRSLRVGQHVL